MFYGVVICNAVVAFFAYDNTLSAEFTYDDAIAVVNNHDVQGDTPISQIFFHDFWGVPVTHFGSHKSYRPLCTISYRLNYMIGELNPFGYHLVNVLLHAVVSGLVTFTANRLFGRFLWPTLLAGLFFALHPIHTEAVAGIVGRADVGACLFFLLSFNCYVTYCVNRDLYPKRKQAVYLLLSVVFAALSMLTKEQGITVLGVNVVFDILHQGQTLKWDHLEKVIRRILSRIKGIIIQIIGGILLLSFRLSHMGGTPGFAPSDNPAGKSNSFLTRTLTFLYLPVFNFGLLLAPINLCFDWSMDSIPLVESLYDLRNVMTFVFYFLIIPSFVLGLNREVEIERMYMTMFGELLHNDDINAKSNGANYMESSPKLRSSPEKVRRPKSVRRRLIASNRNIQPSSSLNNHQNGHGDANSTDTDIIPHFLVVITSVAFMVLPFIPASNLFFYVGFVVAERILYIPSIGYCMLLALGFNQLYVQYLRWYSHVPYHHMTWFYKISFYCGIGLILSLYLGKTHVRNYDWGSDEKLFRSGTNINPAKAWSNLGSTLKNQGRLHEAEHAYREALKYQAEWVSDAHYNLGVLLQDMGKLEEAVTQYSIGAKQSPNNAMVHLNLGFTLDLLKRSKEAEKKYRYVASLDDKYSRNPIQQLTGIISALGYLGKMQLGQGRYKEAIVSFEEALKRRPSGYDVSSIYNMLGESYSKVPDYANAEKFYKKALADKPDNSRAHLAYAITLQNMEQPADADSHFKRAMQLDPNNLQGYEFYNTFLVAQKRLQDSVDMLKTGLQFLPDSYHINYYAATNLRNLKNLEEAEIYYRKIVEIHPNHAVGFRDLGAMLHMNGKHKEALPFYERALELQPNDEMTLENMEKTKERILFKNSEEAKKVLVTANELHVAGEAEEAEKLFRKIVELTPEDLVANQNLGAILYLYDKPEESLPVYEKALKLMPDDEKSLKSIKKVREKIERRKTVRAKELTEEANDMKNKGRIDVAEELLREVTELAPQEISTHKNYGNLLYLNNKLKQAEEVYLYILDKEPGDEIIQLNLAKTQEQMKTQVDEKVTELLADGMDLKEEGDLEQAEEIFRRIVKLTSQDAQAHLNLGDILRQNDKLEEAKESYAEALRLTPDNRLASRNLEEINKALEELKTIEESAL